MELRIKELLQEQGLRMSDLADRLGTNQSNLTKSLAKNPTLSTLEDVAKALKVEMHELFTPSMPSRPTGIAVVGRKTYGMVDMSNIVHIPSYDNYTTLRRDIRAFVKSSVSDDKINAFRALVGGYELVSLIYDKGNKQVILTLYYGDSESKTFFYDLMEYAEWKNKNEAEPVWNLDDMIGEIQRDIEGAVPSPYGEQAASYDEGEGE